MENDGHCLSLVVIGCHWLSLMVIGSYWMSLMEGMQAPTNQPLFHSFGGGRGWQPWFSKSLVVIHDCC